MSENFARAEGLPEYLARVEAGMRQVLAPLGVPLEYGSYYRIDGGPWQLAADKEAAKRALLEAYAARLACGATREIWHMVKALGYHHDTPEGYAARALDLIGQATLARSRNEWDRFGVCMLKLGELTSSARFKAILEKDTLRGRKLVEAGREGGNQARENRRVVTRQQTAAMQAEFARLAAAGKPKMTIYRTLARKHGFNEKTIRRALKRAAAPQKTVD